MRANHGRLRGGFTLVELLLVIAVITILAAMLLPAFERAMKVARQVNCLSNTKQMISGVVSYTSDYRKTLPNSNLTIGGRNYATHWIYLLGPYTELEVASPRDVNVHGTIYRCPSFQAEHLWRGDAYYGLDTSWLGGGYGINYWYLGYSAAGEQCDPPPRWVKLNQVSAPASTIYLGDAVCDPIDNVSYWWRYLYIYPMAVHHPTFFYTRHMGKTNLVWLDGRATIADWSEIKAGVDGDQDYYLRAVK